MLPRALYRVRLENGRELKAGVDAICRGSIVRLIAGDRVLVRPAPRDPSRGQIVGRVRDGEAGGATKV